MKVNWLPTGLPIDFGGHLDGIFFYLAGVMRIELATIRTLDIGFERQLVAFEFAVLDL